VDLPLWTGLRLQALPLSRAQDGAGGRLDFATRADNGAALKDIETALIIKAVEQAMGNVAQAAVALGISRATVYRKLGRKG